MMLQNTESLFNELSRAEITFKPGPPVREYCLLDLEEERAGFLFNGSTSVAAYRSRLLHLHNQFKEELLLLADEPIVIQYEKLRYLRTRIKEIGLILHPLNEEILFANVSFPKYSRRMQSSTDIVLLKKKLIYT
jgi:hypothetical protein